MPSGTDMAGDEERLEQEMVMFLERDQLSVDRRAPLPRARLRPGARVGLWVLRVFTLVVSSMVLYTFFTSLL